MMLGGVLGAEGASFDVGLSLLMLLSLLFFLGAPVVAVVLGVRGWRRARRDGLPGTGWISAALVFTRFSLISLVVALVVVTFGSGGFSNSELDDRYSIEHDWYDEVAEQVVTDRARLIVRLPGTDLPLCPGELVPTIRGGRQVEEYRERQCWARRRLAKDWGKDVDVASAVLERKIVGPPAGVTRDDTLLTVLRIVAILLVVVALDRLLAHAAARRPFAPRDGWWLRAIALSALVLGSIEPWLRDRFADGLARDFLGPRASDVLGSDGGGLHLAGISVALLVLAIGQIWAAGARLQREAEATV